MPELPIPFPQNGVSDTFSYEAQPPGTTVDALNVRAVDSVTGRVRGAQREGLEKVCPDSLGSGKVQAITTVTYDGRQIQYSNRTSATPDDLTTWAKSLDASTAGAGSGVNTVTVDTRGNVFAIVGSAMLVKYNPAGTMQWEFELPVRVANHVVRALAVDEFGDIFVGVSDGTTAQEFAWIRRYTESEDETLVLQWSVNPGAFVEKILLRNDRVYAALNYNDTGKSQVISYENIYTGSPDISRSWYIPHPVNDFALTDSGEVITAHQRAGQIFTASSAHHGNRSFDPRSSETGHVVEPSAMRWDPTKLDYWEERKWVWMNGDTIKSQLGYETIRDGEDVLAWEDALGAKEVVFVKGTGSGDKAPKYLASGLAGRPALLFDGTDYRMETIGGKRLMPGANADEAYLLVMVVKPRTIDPTPQALIYQDSGWNANSKPNFAQYWVPTVSSPTQYESPDGDNGITGKTRFDTVVALNARCGVPVLNQVFTFNTANISNNTYGRRMYKNDRFYLAATLTGIEQIVSTKAEDNYGIGRYGTAVDGTTTFTSGQTVSFVDWHRFSGAAGYVSVMNESYNNEDHSNTASGQYNDPKEAYGRFWYSSQTPPEANAQNPIRPMIVSLLVDNEKCSNGSNVSLFRVNGMPLAQWRSIKHGSADKPTVIGKLRTSDASKGGDQSHGMDDMLDGGGNTQVNFLGLDAEIYEIFCIKQYKDANGQTRVCTFPKYNASATEPASYNENAYTSKTVTGVTIQNGGGSYSVGNIVTVSGGTFTRPAKFTVTSASSTVVTGLSIFDPGEYTVYPTSPASTTVSPAGGTGLTVNLTFGSVAYDSTSDSELEKIEAYFAWKYGIAHLLDSGTKTALVYGPTWDGSAPFFQANDLGRTKCAHPYGILPTPDDGSKVGVVEGPPNQQAKSNLSIDRFLWTSAYSMMVKWNFQRGPRWIKYADAVGHGVATRDNLVFSVGPDWQAYGVSGIGSAALWQDNGANVSLIASKQFFDNGQRVGYWNQHARIAFDKYNRAWVPAYWYDVASSTTLDASDDVLYAFKAPASGLTLDIDFAYKVENSTSHHGLCVAVDPFEVNYGSDAANITRPEGVVLGTEALAANGDTLHYIDMVDAEFDLTAKSRNITWVGVCDGDVVTFDGTSKTTPTGGTNALSANSRFVNAVTAFQKVYFSDGRKYVVYDPVDDEVTPWAATTAGRIPEACRLMTFWRGRMVLARGPDDPHNWHMSAVGDPNDWDQFPPDSPLETQAISGNNSVVGGNHDIINALIPYDRERLMIGGDHSIHMMWGDPMAGGAISLLSDVTGISFGKGWCKDSSGTLYFYGSRGGVYAMAPGGYADRISNHPQRISTETIDRKLSSVNLETHYLGMAWDDIEQRLYLYQMPYTTNAAPMDSWCWEKKTGAWWVDRFAHVNLSPTSIAVLDGDASDDRVIAIGCQDGYVRYPSRTATNDDGYAIDSYVTIGPVFGGSTEMRVRNPKITLARDQGGCWVELYSSDTADVLGEWKTSARLGPGQNPKMMIGVRGPFCWVRLRSLSNGSRWAYESGVVEAISANRRRAP